MYIPNGRYNLISVTKIMKQAWKSEGNDGGMSLSHGNKKLTLDKKIHTTKGEDQTKTGDVSKCL
jgi:hypothetical protein